MKKAIIVCLIIIITLFMTAIEVSCKQATPAPAPPAPSELPTAGSIDGSQNGSPQVYSGPTVSDELPSGWQKTTIPVVESLLGQQLPVPTYFPSGYEVKEVYYHKALNTKPQITYILLLISDQEVEWVGNRYRCRLVLEIGWNELGLGLKMPWAKYISAVQGRLEEKGDEYILWWEIFGIPESESSTLRLYANQEFPQDELIKIAESVPTPLIPSVETELYPHEDIVVPQGETGMVTIRVTSLSPEPLEVSVSPAEKLPQGVEAILHPDTFALNAGDTVDVTVTLRVNHMPEPPKWLRWTPASLEFSTGFPITVTAYHQVSIYFDCGFPIHVYGLRSKEKVTRLRLRFEEPPPIPSGMISLEEAQEAVDFPIRFLLPFYMPEGTEPPFVGLEMAPDEPNGVIVHYSDFQVILAPELGVDGLPADSEGQRVPLNGKIIALVGENRVDWWAYDMHHAVVSDQVPPKELLIIAASMTLFRPESGSWLGEKEVARIGPEPYISKHPEISIFLDKNLEQAIRDLFGGTDDKYMTILDMARQTRLSIHDSEISDLSGMEYCISLTSLSIGKTNIGDISPLSSLTNLTDLSIEDNLITDISPLSSLVNLAELSIEGNRVTDISPLSSLRNLTGLYLAENKLTDLSPLSSLTNLAWLDIENIEIRDISPLASLANLTELYLINDRIDDISPLSSLTNLTDLYIAESQISDISPLSSLSNLTVLSVAHNQICDISPISSLANLKWVSLANNQISDISPLSSLTDLGTLYLSNNQISDVSPLSSLINLNRLFLESNQIADISPLVENSGLQEYDKVSLMDNPLSTESINVYIPQLIKRGVDVKYHK